MASFLVNTNDLRGLAKPAIEVRCGRNVVGHLVAGPFELSGDVFTLMTGNSRCPPRRLRFRIRRVSKFIDRQSVQNRDFDALRDVPANATAEQRFNRDGWVMSWPCIVVDSEEHETIFDLESFEPFETRCCPEIPRLGY